MSNTPGRAGATPSVAQRIASVAAADMFGGVSIRTHSTPSCFACLTMSVIPRVPALSRGLAGLGGGGAGARRPLPQRERTLRVGVDEQTGARGLVDVGREMRREGALARAALARGEDEDIHGVTLQRLLQAEAEP